mmetsp:Transcript_14674/g.55277  ORF Transcript_14674/g.55277 Transcript_14674/m.55277 type:complete len:272 (-) Transcript_14674:666-1481(-)
MRARRRRLRAQLRTARAALRGRPARPAEPSSSDDAGSHALARARRRAMSATTDQPHPRQLSTAPSDAPLHFGRARAGGSESEIAAASATPSSSWSEALAMVAPATPSSAAVCATEPACASAADGASSTRLAASWAATWRALAASTPITERAMSSLARSALPSASAASSWTSSSPGLTHGRVAASRPAHGLSRLSLATVAPEMMSMTTTSSLRARIARMSAVSPMQSARLTFAPARSSAAVACSRWKLGLPTTSRREVVTLLAATMSGDTRP